MANYTPFIQGELISLCLPDARAIDVDGWADWFNDTGRLGATRHGIFPNTRSQQHARLTSMPANDISLLLCDAKAETAFGILSLQNIDLARRDAEISLTIGRRDDKKLPRFATLEGMARLTEHGFKELGLLRVTAGQAAHLLVKWNRQMEMIGYRTEGVLRNGFQRGHTRADVYRIAALYESYQMLVRARNGSFWPGVKVISELAEQQPDISFAEKLSQAISEMEVEHFSYLENSNADE